MNATFPAGAAWDAGHGARVSERRLFDLKVAGELGGFCGRGWDVLEKTG